MPVEFCSLCSEYQSRKVCTRIESSTYDRYFSHYISSKLKRRFSQVQLCNLEIVGERPKKFRLRRDSSLCLLLDTTNIQPSHGATCWVLNFPGFVCHLESWQFELHSQEAPNFVYFKVRDVLEITFPLNRLLFYIKTFKKDKDSTKILVWNKPTKY